MKIAIGCDPNAAELKQELKTFISGLGHECVDFGGDDPIYANTAVRLAKAVAAGRMRPGGVDLRDRHRREHRRQQGEGRLCGRW